MTRHTLWATPGVFALALLAAPAYAQRVSYSYLTYVGPGVSLVSRGDEDTAARVATPILAGDRIATGLSSRAEAFLADGTIVRFDASTQARFEELARTFESEDERTLVSLLSGALAVETRSTSNDDGEVRIDTDDATVVVPPEAFVRVDQGSRGTEIYVRSGYAEVRARAGRVVVRAGDSAHVRGGEAIDVFGRDLPRDRFTQFLEDRRPPRGGESFRYLEQAASGDGGAGEWNEEAATYEASLLDDAGSWVYMSRYGRYCFRPRVDTDWRPYSSGTWRWSPSGLTWVAFEPWGWLPFHFGFWFLDARYGWCWCPGWTYSPAWVYWSYAPSWVGWCPIGFYGGDDTGTGYDGTGSGRFEASAWARLREPIVLTQTDPRGWSYVPTSRMGGRLEKRDIVRADRVGFRPGETGVITAAPLRVPVVPGRPLRAAVLEAIQRVPKTLPRDAEPGPTAIIRRDPVLPREAIPMPRESSVERNSWRSPSRTEPRLDSPAPRIEPQRVEPPRAESTRVEPERVEPPRAEPTRVEPQRVEPPHFESMPVEPQRVEPPHFEPTRVEPERVETPHNEPPPRSEPPPHYEPPPVEPPRFEQPSQVEPPRFEPAPAPRAERE